MFLNKFCSKKLKRNEIGTMRAFFRKEVDEFSKLYSINSIFIAGIIVFFSVIKCFTSFLTENKVSLFLFAEKCRI